MDDNFADIIQDCLERLDQGAMLEDCLAIYPAQRVELAQLLGIATHFTSMPPIAIPIGRRLAIEERIITQAALRVPKPPAPANPRFQLTQLHLIVAFVTLLVVVIFIMLLVLFNPKPGQPNTPPLFGTTRVITTQTPQLPTSQPIQSTTPMLPNLPTAKVTTTEETIHAAPTSAPAPTSIPAAPGDNNSPEPPNDKNCQGQQIGRDEKKCEPDKDKQDDKGKDDKDKD